MQREHQDSEYTTRETTRQVGVRRLKESDSEETNATRYRSACTRLSYLAQDRLDLAATAKHLAQRMSEPRELGSIPLKCAARHLVGKPRDFEDENTSTKSQSSWTATSLAIQSRKKARQVGGSDWQSRCEIWIHSSEVDSPERWRSGVLRSGERRSSWAILEIRIHAARLQIP